MFTLAVDAMVQAAAKWKRFDLPADVAEVALKAALFQLMPPDVQAAATAFALKQPWSPPNQED